MRSTFIALAAFAAVSASAAHAQDVGAGQGRYVSLAAGYVGSSDYEVDFPSNAGRLSAELDSGAAFQGAYGQRIGASLRGEVAVAYRSQDTTSRVTVRPGFAAPSGQPDKFTALSLDLNLYYDIPTGGPVRPYVGAGAGVAQVSIDDGVTDDETSTLNLQAMAGASYALSPRAELFAEARYQRLGTIKVETRAGLATGEQEIDVSNPAVFAGVRFGF